MTPTQKMREPLLEFMEQLAALEHQRWADWQEYVFDSGEILPDGRFVLPTNCVDRWTRQINTKYENLSEKEKESDRREVRRYWHLIEVWKNKSLSHDENDQLRKLRAFARMIWLLAFNEDFEDEERLLALRLNSPLMQELQDYFEQHPWTAFDKTVGREKHTTPPNPSEEVGS